jgi:Effector-associated domain 10/NACHT domain
MSENLQKIIDRVKAGNHTQEDVLAIVSEISAGKLVLASGSGAVAIGGDAANTQIATGNQNVIGDRNTVIYIYGAESEVIQSVVDRYSAIDNTFQQLFHPSASSTVDWDWGMTLLNKKQLPEIRKRLTDTLGSDRVLMDVSIEEQQNWVNRSHGIKAARSPLAADRTLQINGKNCGTLDANKMLIETFGRDDIEGKLLILGAPGAGKTTALLSLAEQLVEGAISQRGTVIPVIFELSTWRNDNQSIQDWLIEQLYDLHGGNRKAKLYEQWLERQVLLPLLDGLDELGLERQKKCTEKLNEFAEHYPQLVVCCRVKEFETVDIKLRNLRGAVCLQSLADSQIQDYFGSLQRPELWDAIKTTPYLQAMLNPNIEGDPGLLQVPLFVKLVADVYDPQQPISSKADLLDKYIDRQLSFDKREIDRRKELEDYKWAYKTAKVEPDSNKTRHHLSWLARNLKANNQVDFLIEHMQPSWIESANLKQRYQLINGLLNMFAWGLILGLVFSLVLRSTIGLLLGFTLAMLYGIVLVPILAAKNDPVIDLCLRIIYSVMFGLSFWLDKDLIKIEPVESFNLSILNVAKQEVNHELKIGLTYTLLVGIIDGIQNGLGYRLITWLIVGSMYVIVVVIITAMKQELRLRSRPNQGIWNSLQSQVWTTTIIFIVSIFPLILFSALHYWSITLFLALILGFSVGGGKACLQHLALRIVLWQSGFPKDFSQFLKYCVERRILIAIGGRYRFLHRELLDHFTQSHY